jgi:PAS domain-containing protein
MFIARYRNLSRTMASSPVAPADGDGGPELPVAGLLEEMERLAEPALLYLPGGKIAALNRAAARLSPISAVGMTIDELLERYGAVRSDGSPVIRGDLPYTRALRGEVVDLGERLTMTLPDGRSYHALVTSTPVIANGRVVAALSVWHDFDAYVGRLAADRWDDGRSG